MERVVLDWGGKRPRVRDGRVVTGSRSTEDRLGGLGTKSEGVSRVPGVYDRYTWCGTRENKRKQEANSIRLSKNCSLVQSHKWGNRRRETSVESYRRKELVFSDETSSTEEVSWRIRTKVMDEGVGVAGTDPHHRRDVWRHWAYKRDMRRVNLLGK